MDRLSVRASHRRVSGYARFGFVLSAYYTRCQAEAEGYQQSASSDGGSDYILEQPVNLQNKQKLKPPTKENVTSWISSALGEMQVKPDTVELRA